MKRREFLTSSATLVGAAAFGGLTIEPVLGGRRSRSKAER